MRIGNRESGVGSRESGAGSRDERFAAVIAGCDTRVALAAVGLVETRAGLEKARRMENENQARSAVLAAIGVRIKEVGGGR